jgi:hypothetical protein
MTGTGQLQLFFFVTSAPKMLRADEQSASKNNKNTN